MVTALVALLMEQIEIDTRGLDMLMEIDYNKILNVDVSIFVTSHTSLYNMYPGIIQIMGFLQYMPRWWL